jgi:predicted DNA-binding protein (UPF0251 family)
MDRVFYKATDIPTRAIVVTLKGLENFSSSKVAEITGINSRTVDRIYKKARDRGFDPTVFPVQLSIEHLEDSARTGRIGKRSDELYNVITDKIKKREEDGLKPYKCLELSNELKQEGFDVSKTTVWRALQNQRFKSQDETEKADEEDQSGKKRKKASKKLDDKNKKKQKTKKISEIKIEESETQEIIQNLQPGQQTNESTSIGLNLPSSILDVTSDNLQNPEMDTLQIHNPAPNIIKPIPDTDSNDEEESGEEIKPEPSLPEQLKESILKDVLDSSTRSPLSHDLELNSPGTPPVKLQSADESVQDVIHTSQSTVIIPDTNKESTSNTEQDSTIHSPLTDTLELNPSASPLIERLHGTVEPLVESQHTSQPSIDTSESVTESTLTIVKNQAISLQPDYEPETSLPKPLPAVELHSKSELIQEFEHTSQPISDVSNSMDESPLNTAQEQIIHSQVVLKTSENELAPHQDTELPTSEEPTQQFQNASLPALNILEPSIVAASSASNDLTRHTSLENVSELNPSERLSDTEFYSANEPKGELQNAPQPILVKLDQVNESTTSITQEKVIHNPPTHETELNSSEQPSVTEQNTKDVPAQELHNTSQCIPDISEPLAEAILNNEQDSNTCSQESHVLELNISETQVDELKNREEKDQKTINSSSIGPNVSEELKDDKPDSVKDLLKNW